MNQEFLVNKEKIKQVVDDKVLENLDQNQLIEKIRDLERENQQLQKKLEKEKKKSGSNLIDFELNEKQKEYIKKYETKKYAIKLSYIGINYQGIQINDTNNTIENYLIKAMMKTLLVLDEKTCDLTRSGRTDKGVSALGNVIAVRLRTNKLKVEQQSAVQNDDSQEVNPLNYLKMINSQLPDDIRVWAITEVPDDFNARHNCTYRVYKYFFFQDKMDIEKMKQAANLLLGEKDFRNFCKVDIMNTLSFVKKINEIDFEIVSENGLDQEWRKLYCITIKGNGFLYHQIRCIMSILFKIGQGIEVIGIIEKLLDIEKTPGRPSYLIADEQPLILHDCYYESLNFENQDQEEMVRIFENFKNLYSKREVEKNLILLNLNQILSKYPETEQKFYQKEKLKQNKERKISAMPVNMTVENLIKNLKGRDKERFDRKWGFILNQGIQMEHIEGDEDSKEILQYYQKQILDFNQKNNEAKEEQNQSSSGKKLKKE